MSTVIEAAGRRRPPALRHLAQPPAETTAWRGAGSASSAWIRSSAAGRCPAASGPSSPSPSPWPNGPSTTPAACATSSIENSPAFYTCLTSQGIREDVTYQPASRYWPFQWTETALYLAAALALAASSFHRLRASGAS